MKDEKLAELAEVRYQDVRFGRRGPADNTTGDLFD